MKKINPFDQGYFCSEDLKNMGFKNVGTNVKIAKNCTIIGLQNINIKNNVRIDGGVTISCEHGNLNIGNYIHIGGNCHLACAGGITLDNFSGLSQGVRVYSSTDDYSGKSLTNPTIPSTYLKTITKPVNIGKHVIIGSGSVVLPGVVIGMGSSVGALSLVTKPLNNWGVYFGIPVKKLKNRNKSLLEKEKKFMKSLIDKI
ncbi:acyltransferase [Alphaproteobacteria bacterium]|nr:acyltransferase [Alphaproteobacteria bacterium]